MPNTYTSVILFPPGKGLFCKNKESFFNEYLYYSKINDPQKIKETESRVQFYQKKYGVHYKVFQDSAHLILEAESLQEAYNTLESFIKDISNVFQMSVSCSFPTRTEKELLDIVNPL